MSTVTQQQTLLELQQQTTTSTKRSDTQQVLVPPIQPFSPQEISKFTALDLALRSHPELAREGASLGLNPRALAKLVHGMKGFQDAHLGRRSKYTATKSWPITKIPDTIFRSRSSTGPLYTLFLASYKLKKELNWKTFDFVSMNRYEDNIQLLKHVQHALIEAKWIVRPVCYFDDSVSDEKRIEYKKIIEQFGGMVVDKFHGSLDGEHVNCGSSSNSSDGCTKDLDKAGSNNQDTNMSSTTNGRDKNESSSPKKKKRKANKSSVTNDIQEQQSKAIVTHIIAWDDEEHDSSTTLEDEKTSPFATNYEIVEKLYLRTISIIDPRQQKGGNQSNIVETNIIETKKKGGRLGGKGKKGKSPDDANSNPLLDQNTPLAFIHWWYLPESYDEFMLASDVDGNNDDIPPKPKGGPWVVGCKFIRDVMKFNEWGLEADYAVSQFEQKVTLYKELMKKKQEEEAKRKKEEELAKKSKDRRKSKSPTLRITLSKKSSASTSEGDQDKKVVKGMAPRQIFTGYYGGGNNRTKIRQVVYDGALNVPKDASDLVHDSIAFLTAKLFGESQVGTKYDLPQLGSVKRPSEDLKLLSSTPLNDISVVGGALIAELRKSSSNVTQITNRKCVVRVSDANLSTIDSGNVQRIRGGGNEEQDNDFTQESNESDPKTDSLNVQVGDVLSVCMQKDDKSNAMDIDKNKAAVSQEPSTTEIIANTEVTKINPQKESKSNAMDIDKIKEATSQEPSITTTNVVDKVSLLTEESKIVSSTNTKVKETMCTEESHDTNPLNESKFETDQSALPSTASSGTLQKNTDHEVKSEQSKKSRPEESKISQLEGTVNEETIVVESKTAASSELPASTDDDINNSESKQVLISANETQEPDNIDLSLTKRESKDVPKESSHILLKETSKDLSSENGPKFILPLQHQDVLDEKNNQQDAMIGDQEPTTTKPSWYDPKSVSSLEMTLLPEWFDDSAKHRTKESYIHARQCIIDLASKSNVKYVTGTAVRRAIPGDAGSLLRLHQLLVNWGFINGSAFNDSTPTEVSKNISRATPSETASLTAATAAKLSETGWSRDMLKTLANSVASFATKKRKRNGEDEQEFLIDWDKVSQNVGKNVTPEDCYRKFLCTNFDDSKYSTIVDNMDIDVEATDDATAITIDNDSREDKTELIWQLVDGVRPSVLQATIDSAFKATNCNISETQKASVIAVVAKQAAERAREEEAAVWLIQQEILDQRMAKLENRLSLLDDLECMFDAERMALELERRDLYTLRCRHWFSGDS